jgi:hypothetical protein
MVVTDPPDPLADLTRVLARHERVFSTGTLLDSLAFASTWHSDSECDRATSTPWSSVSMA